MKKILFKHIPYDWAMFVGYFWMIACFLVPVPAFSVYLPDINEFCQAHPNSSAFVLIAGMIGFAAIAGYPAMRCGSKAYRKSSSGPIDMSSSIDLCRRIIEKLRASKGLSITPQAKTYECFKFDGDLMNSQGEYYVPAWAVDAFKKGILYFGSASEDTPPCELFIKTMYGDVHVAVGDYVLHLDYGILCPCPPGLFEKTYTVVEASDDR